MNRLIVISILLSLMTAPVCGQMKKITVNSKKKMVIRVDTKSGDCFGGEEHNPALLKKDSLKKDSIIATAKTPAKKDSVRKDSIKTDSVCTTKVMKKK